MPIKPAGLADARGREGRLSPAPLRREGKRLPMVEAREDTAVGRSACRRMPA
jgi:hypothetical protein